MPCGCPINRLGKIYGTRTVIKHVGGSMWLCKCTCGYKAVISGKGLDKQKCAKCYLKGGVRAINRVGKAYGYWTVLGYYDNVGRNLRLMCKCQCGTIKPVLAYTLDRGTSKMCRKCEDVSRRDPRIRGKNLSKEPHHQAKYLTNCYVRSTLLERGFPKNTITPELIKLKREQIKLHRLIKERK